MSGDALRSALEARLGAQYEIESLLGRGGMGSVFRATDRTLHRPVAIKVISGDVATNPELKERFLLEARTVAKLRHPNIVSVYSAGEADGLLYFVMELVPGESLRDLLEREKTVDPQRAERILHELALALDYAHANGIVHRDVKPENILLDRETGRAMLTDFGVARALESSGNITGTGMILGSPRYMSPEQATGEQTLDGRSDLYALALVGYEMFTGKPVVDAGNMAAMLVKHLTETPPPISERAPAVPEGAAMAIDRALAKDREQRWRNGREMAEVIGMAWTPTPGTGVHGVTRAAAAAQVTSPVRRGMVLGAFGAVAVAALAFFGFRLGESQRGDPRKSYAVVPFEVQSGNRDVQWLRDGAVNMLTLALSQWSDLTVADYERTLKLVKDVGAENSRVGLDEAQTIARRAGAGTLVMGQVSTTQDSLVVVARLYDVRSGDALNTATRAAALTDDPRPLFDDLARYLLDVAGGQSSASVDVARATTSSITAYRAYLDGVRLLNSWRLDEADSALRVAIAADSTFALAWHKRALALGWGGGGEDYLRSAERAVALADRLPRRQQALVRGHLSLAQGLFGQFGGPGANVKALREAQAIYTQLLAEDSLAAEGWYGLADAYFHDSEPGDSAAAYQRRFNLAMRGFHRTLAIDSSFHLAYQHLVQQYQQLSSVSAGALFDGDSAIIPATPAAAQRLIGIRSAELRRADAQRRGLEIARGWVRADADAPAAHIALANSYLTVGQPDSAIVILEGAMQRPTLDTPGMRLTAVLYHLFNDDPVQAFSRARDALSAPIADLRRTAVNERIVGYAASIAAAASVGNAGEMDRMLERIASVDSVLPFTRTSTKESLAWYITALRTSITGTVSAAERRTLVEGTRNVIGGRDPRLAQAAALSGGVPYGAYLLTRDTIFSNAVRTLPGYAGATFTDLDALEALTRGDTAAALALARTYTPPESLSNSRISFVGLRMLARAEVLAAVGNTAWALGYLEAIDPARIISVGLGEPGFPLITRSYLTRGALHEELGNRSQAIAAYEEFLRRTESGDAAIEPQRRIARSALQRLRDSAR